MKKVTLLIFGAILFISLIGILPKVSAIACDLQISLLNQDPYPAIPEDYVKIVFEIDGVSNPECGQIEFELLQQYPLIFDPGQNTKEVFNSGTYNKDFNSFKTIPYKVRIDPNALNGETPIEVRYKTGMSQAYLTEQFDINIEDVRADFEIHIKDYNPLTKEITFEIANIAKNDITLFTLMIPEQENLEVKGANINIVGDLDAKDYTTATFEATPKKGEITLNLTYTDLINVRRTLQKTVTFEPKYFEGRANGKQKISIWLYLFWVLVIIAVIRHFHRKRKAKKKAQIEQRNKK